MAPRSHLVVALVLTLGTPEASPAQELTRAPALRAPAEAVYPPEAAAAGIEGAVVLEVDIAADGTVADARVVEPAGHGFDEAALEAVRRFRFEPAEIDGAPAAVRIQYRYRFALSVPAPPSAKASAAAQAETPPPPRSEILLGRLLERGTRLPLAGVEVAAGSERAVTNGEGRFHFALPAGRVEIEAEPPEHEPLRREVELRAGKTAEETFYLRRRAFSPYEATVRGKRERNDIARTSLSGEELTRVPGTFGEPLRVVQALPGVARAPYILGWVIARGAPPSGTGFLLDDQPVPQLFHFGAGPEVVNPAFIERIDFYPGGYPAEYGRYQGGLVAAGTRPGRADGRLRFAADADFFDAGVFVEAPVGPVTVTAAARRSYADAIIKLVSPLPILPRYWDYQARADARLPDGSRLTAFAYGSDDALDLPATTVDETAGSEAGETQTVYRVLFHRAQVRWKKALADGLDLDLLALGGYDLAGFGIGDTVFNADAWTAALRAQLKWQWTPAVRVDVGTDLYYDRYFADVLRADLPGPADAENLKLDVPRWQPGAWINAAFKGERVRLDVGARLDGHAIEGRWKWAFDPRVTGKLRLFDLDLWLKGGLGMYHQPPQPQELANQIGNPDLGFVEARQWALGAEAELPGALAVDVTGFVNEMSGLVQTTRDLVQRDGAWVPQYYKNGGTGRAFGVEMMVRRRMSERLFGWIAYTLSRSERLRSNGTWNAYTYDQTHILNVVASFRPDAEWELGARFRLATGNPYTPVRYARFDADAGTYRATRGEPNSARLPMFHQLDVRVDKKWEFEEWVLSAYLEVMNVYNARNEEFYLDSYDYSKVQGVPGLPIFPSLGVKAEW